jgi:transposase-like protein DUF772
VVRLLVRPQKINLRLRAPVSGASHPRACLSLRWAAQSLVPRLSCGWKEATRSALDIFRNGALQCARLSFKSVFEERVFAEARGQVRAAPAARGAVRSERRLCEEVHLNLAYRWFCRLGLGGEVPDHSTFSKNRHGRFRDCDLLRKLFETVVRRCMAEGLIDGAAFAVDASLIAADANKQRSAAGSDEVDWQAIARTRRSVREYLDTLDEAAWGAASETVPKFISKSDPAAQWTGAHKGHASPTTTSST